MLPALRRRHGTDHNAFTLVELAIVVAIVGVLAAVGAGRYQVYLERARIARAIVELRGIATRIELAEEESRVLPSNLVDVGVTTLDPWGNPYRYLLLQGNLPVGLADGSPDRPSVAAGLPSVQAGGPPDASGGGSGGAGGGGGGGTGGGTGGGGDDPSTLALARKDRFLVPINSDFDLYSMGPDGRTKATLSAPVSRDDVIRAEDGAYYGLAEKF